MSLWSKIKAWFVKEEKTYVAQFKEMVAAETPKVEAIIHDVEKAAEAAVVSTVAEVKAAVVEAVVEAETVVVAEVKKVVADATKTRKSRSSKK